MVGFLALFNIPDGFDDESNGFASSGRLGYRSLGAGSYSGGHVSALFPAACWGASEPFYGPGGSFGRVRSVSSGVSPPLTSAEV